MPRYVNSTTIKVAPTSYEITYTDSRGESHAHIAEIRSFYNYNLQKVMYYAKIHRVDNYLGHEFTGNCKTYDGALRAAKDNILGPQRQYQRTQRALAQLGINTIASA